MYFIGTMGQRLMIGLPRVLGKILAIGVLLAVPTLGLARLSGDLLTSWQARNADEVASVQNALDGLLAFDAPASTYRQHQLRVNDSSSSRPGEGATKPSLLVEDWRFTATTPPDLTPVINGYLNTIVRDQFISDLLLLNAGVPTNIVNALIVQQIASDQMLAQDLLITSRTVPINTQMINGFVGSFLVNELIFDHLLINSGIDPNTLVMLLGHQLGFNEVSTQFLLNVAQMAQPTPASPTT